MSLLHCQFQGQGPKTLVCLHSSGASGRQWRALAEALHGHCRLQCIDLLGHGQSAGWPQDAPDALAIEAEAVWTALGPQPAALDLVGHSYGGAVALQMALQQPERVRSLTLYEPVLFGLLARHEPWGEAWDEIDALAERLDALLAAGRPDAAAALFCDYWADGPAWMSMNALQQQALERRMPTVARHFRALFAATWGPAELGRLAGVPLRLLCGGRTRAPARRVAELLALALPDAGLDYLPAAGHLGPLSHGAEFATWLAGGQRPRRAQACA